MQRIGLGLAALGRPGSITRGQDVDLPDRTVEGMRARTRCSTPLGMRACGSSTPHAATASAADAGWTVVVKETLANGAAMDALPGAHPDADAIAAALAIDPRVVVLSGAVTVEQLHANLRAVDVDGAEVARVTEGLVRSPDAYWRARGARAWR